MRWLGSSGTWGLCPQTPGIYRVPARITVLLRNWGRRPQTPAGIADGRRLGHLPAIPAAESALGLRPRRALPSAQVLPGWTTSTSPCNNLTANGDSPLNFVSHSRGSLQRAGNRHLIILGLKDVIANFYGARAVHPSDFEFDRSRPEFVKIAKLFRVFAKRNGQPDDLPQKPKAFLDAPRR